MTCKNTTMRRPRTLEELNKIAIEIPSHGGIKAFYPKETKNERTISYPVYDDKNLRGKYNHHKEVLCYIDWNSKAFIIPVFYRFFECLNEDIDNQFHRESFFVPFCNGAHPDKYLESELYNKWIMLIMATKEWDKEYHLLRKIRLKAAKECKAKNLPAEIFHLGEFIEIPVNGMVVDSLNGSPRDEYPLICKPDIDDDFFKKEIVPNLGKYNIHDGVLQVNTNDGQSFYCRSYDKRFKNILEKAGYIKDETMRVCFSRGERALEEEF